MWLATSNQIAIFQHSWARYAQLVERSLPTPEVRSSNPVISKLLYGTFVHCQLYWKDENKETEARNGSFLTICVIFFYPNTLRYNRLSPFLLKISLIQDALNPRSLIKRHNNSSSLYPSPRDTIQLVVVVTKRNLTTYRQQNLISYLTQIQTSNIPQQTKHTAVRPSPVSSDVATTYYPSYNINTLLASRNVAIDLTCFNPCLLSLSLSLSLSLTHKWSFLFHLSIYVSRR